MNSRDGKKPESENTNHRCRRERPCRQVRHRGPWGLLLGVAALIWLLLRTGAKPSRLSYPCQQSAIAVAFLNLVGPVAVILIAARAGAQGWLRSNLGRLVGGMCVSLLFVIWASASFEASSTVQQLAPPPDHHPNVYFVRQSRGVNPLSFGGVDDLVTLMGTSGSKLHRSLETTLTSGPGGLIGVDDVVLLKVNAQWAERGGTNTDVVRGVMRNIVEHPDGFVGEIVVVDNGQGYGHFNRADNNAEDTTQSIVDVVAELVDEGWSVSSRLWDGINEVPVAEYIAGDDREGYVVTQSLDPQTSIRASYPKFQTAQGTSISYKYGVWDPNFALYGMRNLVVINMPVLKTHSIYAVTASVKNFMGVVTRRLSTDSHNGVARGAMGTILADVRMPDLTILDAIWTLAHPGLGPASSYESASFTNQLVAGTDPVVLDMWAVRNILIPQILAHGYESSAWSATQDPDNPSSVFRNYLDRSMNEMLLAAIPTTNQTGAVALHVWAGDWDADGDLDLAETVELVGCTSGPDASAREECGVFDYNADLRADMLDIAAFQNLFTGSLD